MPKHSSSILELARRGAQARLIELQVEMQEILRQFPDLAGDVSRTRRAAKAVPIELSSPPRRRRRMMSRAQRRVVSERMKKYWAGRREAAKKK